MRTVRILALALSALLPAAALAKLPPPSDEQKAKAEEAAARAAWGGKVAGFQLCKSMERVAAKYYADAKQKGMATKPPVDTAACADPGPFQAAGSAAPAAPAVAPAAPAAPAAAAPAKKS